MYTTLKSAGVAINEVDLSLFPVLPAGTNIFMTGFSPQGPTDEILQINDIGSLEAVYGTPTTPAERYFYYTAKQIIDANAGTLLINRLPYGENTGYGFGSKYSALVYPVDVYDPVLGGLVQTYSVSSCVYRFHAPVFIELTSDQYYSILDGTAFTWSDQQASRFVQNLEPSLSALGQAGMIILNKGMTTIDDKFEGYYIGISDNVNLLPSMDFDSIVSVKSINSTAPDKGVYNYPSDNSFITNNGLGSYITVPPARLNFSLSATKDSGSSPIGGSISEVIENAPSFKTFTDEFDDTLTIGVFKLRQNPYSPTSISLGYSLVESYTGSLDYWRKVNNEKGGNAISFYLGNQDSWSQNITILINDNITNRNSTTWLNSNGKPQKKVRVDSRSTHNLLTTTPTLSSLVGFPYQIYTDYGFTQYTCADSLFPLGAYSNTSNTQKSLGSIPLKLDRALQKLDNDETIDLDLIVEAGLGTIYAAASANETSYYDDTQLTNGLSEGLAALQTTNAYVGPNNSQHDLRTNYAEICNKFVNLCQNVRKDCLFIADPLRHIMVQGNNTKTLSNPSNSFSQYIYSPLLHQFELFNTSYATCFANWGMVNDEFSGTNIWVPFSGFAAADMARSDANFAPWYAPAGFTRGVITGLDDIAITPKQKERDQLYKISMNPVTTFPSEGIVIWGQKTLLGQPSAFNRINVRRLFLYLEKATKSTMKYFVFEPNTLFTRTRVVNTLTPIFEMVKNQQGLYDFLIICNASNNTGAVIDQNQLVVDIYLQAVRAAEFIYCNFISTPTGTNFSELIAPK